MGQSFAFPPIVRRRRSAPAALFHYARDPQGKHPPAHLSSRSAILQDNAYGGYGEIYASGRIPALVIEAGSFARARRQLFELATVARAALKKSRGKHGDTICAIAPEAAHRIDNLFHVERGISGEDAIERLAVCRN